MGKTLEERWLEELPSDNTDNFLQCKTCKFRDRIIDTKPEDEEDYSAWQKCHCRIYGRESVLEINIVVPYLPVRLEDKPMGLTDNSEQCKYYQEETRTAEEVYLEMAKAVERYRREYKAAYGDINSRGCPRNKNRVTELIIAQKIRDEDTALARAVRDNG